MKALLFDLYASGHHLEYAGKLCSALAERDPDLEVEFLTPGPADNEAEFFGEERLTHLYDRSPLDGDIDALPDREPFATGGKFLATEVLNPRWRVVRDVAAYAAAGDYDVVHCLEVDKILPALRCHFDGHETPLVGSINGIFFKPVDPLLPPTRAVRSLATRVGPCRFARTVPPFLRKGLAWNRWFLGQCLDHGVFDHLLVPSAEAAEDAAETAVADRVTVVPDPLEPWDEDVPDRGTARERLDLPAEEPIVLFFGQLVEEKGLDTLFRALETYDGPPFTLVIAGSPSATSGEEVAAVADRSGVSVVPRLEFVLQSEVRDYFRAADGVVLPYDRSFGALRTSGVFQKVCAADRPMIASDFGIFGRRVREWDLGLLSDPESPADLAETLATFVASEDPVYDPASMAEYARTQTFERLAELTRETYRRVAGDGPRLSASR